MPKFNVGDTVQCLNDSDVEGIICKGQLYEVGHISGSTSSPVLGLKGVFGGFRGERFRVWKHAVVPKVNKPELDPIEVIPAKRELRTGVYGRLEIHTGVAHPNQVGLRLTGNFGVDFFTVDELDELIFTLSQAREFLKDV